MTEPDEYIARLREHQMIGCRSAETIRVDRDRIDDCRQPTSPRQLPLAQAGLSIDVFASSVDNLMPILASAVTKAMSRLTKELEIDGASPHDLRRTVGTELAMLGQPVHIRKLALNHSPRSRDVTDTVYNRYAYDREKREALEAWERHVKELLALK